MSRTALVPVLLCAAVAGCAAPRLIAGTKVIDTQQNRELLEVCEKYRHAMEDRDAETLISMASRTYFEDSGTPKGDDDYGYDGLRQILASRLAALKSIRYNVQYRNVEVQGNRAHVDIRYDASFQLATELGDRWERKQNEKRLELENDGKRWLFTSGM
jgi:hypothetical protein